MTGISPMDSSDLECNRRRRIDYRDGCAGDILDHRAQKGEVGTAQDEDIGTALEEGGEALGNLSLDFRALDHPGLDQSDPRRAGSVQHLNIWGMAGDHRGVELALECGRGGQDPDHTGAGDQGCRLDRRLHPNEGHLGMDLPQVVECGGGRSVTSHDNRGGSTLEEPLRDFLGDRGDLLERPSPVGGASLVGEVEQIGVRQLASDVGEDPQPSDPGIEYPDHVRHVSRREHDSLVASPVVSGGHLKVEGSVAVVTGGVSGLGFGVATRLVGGGGRVVMLDVNEVRGLQAVAELGASARFALCDVRDPDSVAAAVSGAIEEFGRIDILVNAAGVAPAQRVVARDGSLFDLDLFRFVVDVNLVGMFDVIRNVAGAMAANEPGDSGERGVIINVASIAAFEGQVGQAAYSASKGGVVAMTLPLARDLASIGVRVMCGGTGDHGHTVARRGPRGAYARRSQTSMSFPSGWARRPTSPISSRRSLRTRC